MAAFQPDAAAGGVPTVARAWIAMQEIVFASEVRSV